MAEKIDVVIDTPMVWSSLNAWARPKNYKKNTKPSQTVPDQSLTIKELIDKHSRGINLGAQLTPMYQDDYPSQGLDIRKLDLVEVQELKLKVKQDIEDLQKAAQAEIKLKKAQHAAAELEKQAKELEEKEINEFKKSKASKSNNNP